MPQLTETIGGVGTWLYGYGLEVPVKDDAPPPPPAPSNVSDFLTWTIALSVQPAGGTSVGGDMQVTPYMRAVALEALAGHRPAGIVGLRFYVTPTGGGQQVTVDAPVGRFLTSTQPPASGVYLVVQWRGRIGVSGVVDKVAVLVQDSDGTIWEGATKSLGLSVEATQSLDVEVTFSV